MSKTKCRYGTALFDEGDDIREGGLRAIETCPNCLKFTFSEVVVCKGINKIENRGRFYQKVGTYLSLSQLFGLNLYRQCLNNVGNPSRSPRKRRKVAKETDEYRPYCDGFKWRVDYQQMPDWWVSEVTQPVTPGSKKPPVRCPSESCQMRPKPHNGNRECSNGQLCKECCLAAQDKGYFDCLCSSHNRSLFDEHLDNVGVVQPNLLICSQALANIVSSFTFTETCPSRGWESLTDF